MSLRLNLQRVKAVLQGLRTNLRLLATSLIFLPIALWSQETFQDTFSNVSYANNDGTLSWSSDWIESGDVDLGPTATYVYINGGVLRMEYLFAETISRSANLSGASTATLSFDYTSVSLGGPRSLGVYISLDGVGGFTLIGTLSGSGTFSQDISAYISANTTIRFANSGTNWSADDLATIDNVQITADIPARLVVEDITVDENTGSASVTITHAGANASGPFSATFATSDGTATAGNDYTATSGTVNFSGISGDTETVIVPILDDALFESFEEFSLAITTVSDPTVNFSIPGTITIRDDEVIANDVPLSLYRNFNGYYDYSSTGGTFRTASNDVDPCAITNTSSGTLTSTVPLGAPVKAAYLFWSHSGISPDDTVTFEGASVTADLIYSADFTGRNFYGYIAEVTQHVAGIADLTNNTFDLTDLTIDISEDYCSTATVLGAWSLMVFYEDTSQPACTINLYYGFDITQNAGTSFTLDNFYAISPSGSKATFLSYEGDATLDGSSAGSTNPEELSITNQTGTNFILSGDGGQTGNNPYNSTVYNQVTGTNIADSYGLDLDTYDISGYINSTDSQVTANVDVGQDLIISSAVVISVPSNQISGVVFEDLNYPGGAGRDYVSSGSTGIPGATVELYDDLGTLLMTTTTDTSGDYSFIGMSDGNYIVRVPNGLVPSSRIGGVSCTDCYPIQTYRNSFNGTFQSVVNEIGGANPAASADTPAGTLIGAQSQSPIVISGGGVADIQFGFNFNTIVNTNADGQGSVAQFIKNSNALDESTLDIEANVVFDPDPGMDLSVFMIPPISDPLGRTADSGYNSGVFSLSLTTELPEITGDNTQLDGRTQTAYSGDSNPGSVGAGGANIGTGADILPQFTLPEIDMSTTALTLLKNSGNGTQIRAFSLRSIAGTAISVQAGTIDIEANLLGTDALGGFAASVQTGIDFNGGNGSIYGNFIASNLAEGVLITQTSGLTVSQNHFTQNGLGTCGSNLRINNGLGIRILKNMFEAAEAVSIEAAASPGALNISNNSIYDSGRETTCYGGLGGVGIRLGGNNSLVANNLIYQNGNAGIVVRSTLGKSNRITKNSIYANGTTSPALGIDLDVTAGYGDGITLNDFNDADTGPNDLLNFPMIASAFVQGNELIIKGWARPSSELEFFLTDIGAGSANLGDNSLGLVQDYGEGQVYIGTLLEGSAQDLDSGTFTYNDPDGNTDNTNSFEARFTLPTGITTGDFLTGTATTSSGTSEFGPMTEIRIRTVITNRRITYRVGM